MTFPAVQSITSTVFSTAATSHLVAMPAVVDTGDLLLCVLNMGFGYTVTTPGGWSAIENSNTRLAVYAKDAAGTEDGTTVDFVSATAAEAVAQVYRITGWNGTVPTDIATATLTTGTSSNPDPGSVTPSWGALDTLWIAVERSAAGETVSSYPANYTNGTYDFVASNIALATSRREINAATENPGTYTISASGTWYAVTIAVRPAAVAPVPTHIGAAFSDPELPEALMLPY